MHVLFPNSDLVTALWRVITFNSWISSWVYEYRQSNFSLQENMENYVLLILKMQQIRPKNKVLHGSASNYKLSDLHKWIEAANQHIITNRRLRLPITKQTINKYCYSSWVGDTSQLSIRFPWQFARTQSYFWLQVQLLAQKHEKIIRRDLGSTFCDPIADLSSIKSRFCLSNVETKSNGNSGKEHGIL